MNARLSNLSLKLVALDANQFAEWPQDRSLALLTDDARALRRRALKGVGVGGQRGLYFQVARRIDTLALTSKSPAQVTLNGACAEAVFRLEDAMPGAEEQVLKPGAEVEAFSKFFMDLSVEHWMEQDEVWRALGVNAARDLVHQLGRFAAVCRERGRAIVRVVYDPVLQKESEVRHVGS